MLGEHLCLCRVVAVSGELRLAVLERTILTTFMFLFMTDCR